MVVTIDGPAGVGKSTLSRCLAERLGWLHLNSGLLYRYAGSIFTGDWDQLLEAFSRDFNIQPLNTLRALESRSDLRTVEAGERASLVSAYPPLRALINSTIRQIARHTHMVAEGRDMSTVAFPDALLKIYLDAELSERARRRWEELGGREPLEKILQSLAERDRRDREKEQGALRQAENAWYLDCTHLTIVEVCEKVLDKIKSRIGQGDDHVG